MDRHNKAISLKCNMLMNFSFTFHLLIDRYWIHISITYKIWRGQPPASQSVSPYHTWPGYHTPYTMVWGIFVCINLHCNHSPPPTAVDVQLMPNLRAWIIVYCAPVKVPPNPDTYLHIICTLHICILINVNLLILLYPQ